MAKKLRWNADRDKYSKALTTFRFSNRRCDLNWCCRVVSKRYLIIYGETRHHYSWVLCKHHQDEFLSSTFGIVYMNVYRQLKSSPIIRQGELSLMEFLFDTWRSKCGL